jgi:hypothetical protein
MKTYSMSQIEGLDAAEIRRLKSLGIRTTTRFLEEAQSPKARRQLAEQTGISEQRVLQYANACDHMRIKGMGKQYINLLREAGVDTVRELRYRKPENLVAKMKEINAKRRLVRVLPSQPLVVRWVEQANKLPLKIRYKD